MNESPKDVEIKEVRSEERALDYQKKLGADLYVQTGKTGGRTFLVSVGGVGDRATLIALHL